MTPSISQPKPIKAKLVPSRLVRKSNPRIYGWLLVVLSYVFESIGFIRRYFWHHAGFSALREIAEHIENAEPRLDPTVLPSEVIDTSESDLEHISMVLESVPDLSKRHGTYSVAYFRSLFLSGELTPLDLVKAILPLIRRDTSPPGEYSTGWVEVKPDLILQAAEESTRRYKDNKSLGPLDGIPTAVKDEFDVQGYTTTLGSAFDLTTRNPEGEACDSWCVAKLKEAGAIILGKANMHEFGMDTSGVNVTHGTPRNPYNKRYYPGGSSSGSAYVVASGLVPVAVGTDGGGSVRVPSSFCSLFGLKPTHGRISYNPGKSHASSCEVIGPIAADMQSLAIIWAVISKPHPTSSFPRAPPAIASDSKGRPKVIGIYKDWWDKSAANIRGLCSLIVQQLSDEKGYTIVPIEIPFVAEGQMAHALTMLTHAATGITQTGGISAANRILAALGQTSGSTDFMLAQMLRNVLMQHLAYLWQEHPGMIIVTPTTACAGWPIRSLGELKHGISDANQTMMSMEYVWMANFCGTPSITVPVGYLKPEGQEDAGNFAREDTVGKIPVGMMATGEWASEHLLLRFGSDVEEVHGERERRPPSWVDVVELAKKGK